MISLSALEQYEFRICNFSHGCLCSCLCKNNETVIANVTQPGSAASTYVRVVNPHCSCWWLSEVGRA